MLEEQEIEVLKNKLSSIDWIDGFDIIKTSKGVNIVILAKDTGETVQLESFNGNMENVSINVNRTIFLLEECSELIGINKAESLSTYLISDVDEFLDRREELMKE